MSVAVPIILFAWICVAIWVMACTSIAHQERMKLIVLSMWRPVSGIAILKAEQAVSFYRHTLARVLFRDAWALYDPIVRHAVDHPDSEIVGGIHIVFTEDGPHVKTYGGVNAGDLQLMQQHDDEDVVKPKPH